MSSIFHSLVYQPLYNILIFLYNIFPGKDFGIAIVLMTILIRVALIPIYKKQIESQKKLQELQPKIKELQERTKNDKERQTRELMELYKNHKTNPFSGCMPLVIQLIIFIAIYQVLINISNSGLQADAAQLYSFVSDPGKINHLFIGLIDLTKPNVVLAVLAALAQYFQSKMLMLNQPKNIKKGTEDDKPDISQIMSKQMLYLGPFLTLFIGIKFASGLALYWLAGTLFMLIQQIWIQRKKEKETQAA